MIAILYCVQILCSSFVIFFVLLLLTPLPSSQSPQCILRKHIIPISLKKTKPFQNEKITKAGGCKDFAGLVENFAPRLLPNRSFPDCNSLYFSPKFPNLKKKLLTGAIAPSNQLGLGQRESFKMKIRENCFWEKGMAPKYYRGLLFQVSVSKTPGHTKHFQTIFISKSVKLCDCPGLVFPSLMPKQLQVAAFLVLLFERRR